MFFIKKVFYFYFKDFTKKIRCIFNKSIKIHTVEKFLIYIYIIHRVKIQYELDFLFLQHLYIKGQMKNLDFIQII